MIITVSNSNFHTCSLLYLSHWWRPLSHRRATTCRHHGRQINGHFYLQPPYRRCFSGEILRRQFFHQKTWNRAFGAANVEGICIGKVLLSELKIRPEIHHLHRSWRSSLTFFKFVHFVILIFDDVNFKFLDEIDELIVILLVFNIQLIPRELFVCN